MFKDRVTCHYSEDIEMEGKLPFKDLTSRKYILYWMDQSKRVEYNHVLNYSIQLANELNKGLIVCFGLDLNKEDQTERTMLFMLQGFLELSKNLEDRGIPFLLKLGNLEDDLSPMLKDIYSLVLDKGYLKQQRKLKNDLCFLAKKEGVISCFEVESDICVPVEVTSSKEEYMARTIRPKIWAKLYDYIEPIHIPEIKIKTSSEEIKNSGNISTSFKLDSFVQCDEAFINQYMLKKSLDLSVKKSELYYGGYSQAIMTLDDFMEYGLANYNQSNNPGNDYTSKLSMYLHFGHISPIEIYYKVSDYSVNNNINEESLKSFLEQLIVRRELAINYVYYRKGYSEFETMTNPWAYLTMNIHNQDLRDNIYTLKQLEAYNTHDMFWNAAMCEMVTTGYMHNYMRMYWCKKIIEWTPNFKTAYETAVYLNDKYFLDGRDPNSYTGIAWCFGLHDQGWRERKVFGKLRYMNSEGLRKKFDMDRYIERVWIKKGD